MYYIIIMIIISYNLNCEYQPNPIGVDTKSHLRYVKGEHHFEVN
jgi:hypothetical protein